jgi:hypothetical protein
VCDNIYNLIKLDLKFTDYKYLRTMLDSLPHVAVFKTAYENAEIECDETISDQKIAN